MSIRTARLVVALVSVCVGALPLAAAAQDRDWDEPPRRGTDYDYDDRHRGDYDEVVRSAYVGVGGIAGIENFDSGSRDFSSAGGFNVMAGGRVHEHIAVEFDFRYLIDFESDPGFVESEVDIWALTGNVKGIVFPGRIEPYALFGMGVLQAWTEAETPVAKNETTDTGFLVRFGAGVDLHVSRRWTVNLQGTFEAPTGEAEDYQHGLVGASLRYRF